MHTKHTTNKLMSTLYPDTYYAATRNLELDNPLFDQGLEVETCIIGGGYAGLMTALGLVERGHGNIALIELRNKF